jgi:hypothetical protein
LSKSKQATEGRKLCTPQNALRWGKQSLLNCKTCRQAAATDSTDTQHNTSDGEAISGLHYKHYRKLAMAHQQSISAIYGPLATKHSASQLPCPLLLRAQGFSESNFRLF